MNNSFLYCLLFLSSTVCLHSQKDQTLELVKALDDFDNLQDSIYNILILERDKEEIEQRVLKDLDILYLIDTVQKLNLRHLVKDNHNDISPYLTALENVRDIYISLITENIIHNEAAFSNLTLAHLFLKNLNISIKKLIKQIYSDEELKDEIRASEDRIVSRLKNFFDRPVNPTKNLFTFKLLLNDADTVSGNELRVGILKMYSKNEKFLWGIDGIFSTGRTKSNIGIGAKIAYNRHRKLEGKNIWLPHGGIDLHFNDGIKIGLGVGLTFLPKNADVGFGISFSSYRTKIGGNFMIRL